MEPSSSVELKVISCQNLSVFNFFQKLNAYAVVSIVSDDPKIKLEDKKTQKQTTPTDRDVDGDGNNPEWNHEMCFSCNWVSSENMDNLFLDFEVRHDVLFSYKTVGNVRVPLTDLFRESVDGVVRFVRYEIRTADGRANGILNFCYKVNGNPVGASCSQQTPQRTDVPSSVHITGYPIHEVQQIQSENWIQYPVLELESSSSCWSAPYTSSESSSLPAPMPTLVPYASSAEHCYRHEEYQYAYSYPPPPPSVIRFPEPSYGFRPPLSMINEVHYPPPASPFDHGSNYTWVSDPNYRPHYWA